MALTTGTRLAPYETLALIGAGGMGDVYKAKAISQLNRPHHMRRVSLCNIWVMDVETDESE